MKKNCLFSLGIILALCSQAQINSPNVVASGGNYFVAGTFTNSYTIGEMAMVETVTTSGFILTQGFQQPSDLFTVVIPSDHFYGFSAFPNPSNGQISFEYNLAKPGHINVEVFDAIGQLIYRSADEKLAGPQHDQLNLSSFANGLYTVRYSLITADGNNDFFVSRITLSK